MVYSVAEAAELLGVSRSTAYELVARGELATVRIGRRRMVTRPMLTELLGMEPPLPFELDELRSLPAPEPTPLRPARAAGRRETADPGQPSLAFRAG